MSDFSLLCSLKIGCASETKFAGRREKQILNKFNRIESLPRSTEKKNKFLLYIRSLRFGISLGLH